MDKTDERRTHEPDLRELTAELDGLRDFLLAELRGMRGIVDERDRRYVDRFLAMDEKTGLALTASKEAVVTAAAATEKRFDSVNEFRKTLSDQTSQFITRAEYLPSIKSLEDKIAGLRESRSEASGAGVSQHESKAQSNYVIGLVISIILGLSGWVAFLAQVKK